jgi:hypothetical protein
VKKEKGGGINGKGEIELKINRAGLKSSKEYRLCSEEDTVTGLFL